MKDFKVIEFKKDTKSYAEVEETLKQKSSEGWEVISMSIDMSADIRGTIVVLLQKAV